MQKISNIKTFHILLIATIASLIWFLFPCPHGLSVKGWHLLIIFVSTMTGVMLAVIPLCGTMFLSLLIASLTHTIDLKTQGFSGFANMIPWLLLFILSISKTLTKSTIGLRVTYFFMKIFGKNIMGLAYSISLTELILAPILPSNTARAASVGFPIVTSLSKYLGENIKNVSEQTIGRFLTLVYSSSNSICSATFLTAMISNAIIVESAQTCGFTYTWASWITYTIIPSTLILIIIPIVLYYIVPPKVTNLENLQQEASKKIRELGPLTSNEKKTLFTFLFMLVMWILADTIKVNVITTTLIGLCVFIYFEIITVREILSDGSAMSSIITIGILISYAGCLSEYGVVEWLTHKISSVVQLCPNYLKLYAITIMYFFTHYFFSGEGGRIVTLFLPFAVTGLAMGIDKVQLITTLTVFSSFSDLLAHYTAPSSIIMFSTGYITAKKWMATGLILSCVVISIWFVFL